MNIAIIFSLLIAFVEELSEMTVTTNKLIIILTVTIMTFLYMLLTRKSTKTIDQGTVGGVFNKLGLRNPLSTPTSYSEPVQSVII